MNFRKPARSEDAKSVLGAIGRRLLVTLCLYRWVLVPILSVVLTPILGRGPSATITSALGSFGVWEVLADESVIFAIPVGVYLLAQTGSLLAFAATFGVAFCWPESKGVNRWLLYGSIVLAMIARALVPNIGPNDLPIVVLAGLSGWFVARQFFPRPPSRPTR